MTMNSKQYTGKQPRRCHQNSKLRAAGVLALACLSLQAATAHAADAQQTTAIQEQLRQQQREEALRKQLQPEPDVRLPSPTAPSGASTSDLLPESEAPCFNIQRVELQGTDAALFEWALPAAHLTPTGLVDSAVNRCLGVQGVNTVLSRVQNAIIARGYVTTRVLAPAQNLQSGTLALTVLVGRVRSVRTTQDSGPRVRLSNALPIRSGDILNLRDLEQGLENLQRVPTVQADVQIVPAQGEGAGPGESDLEVRWVQNRIGRFAVSLDDGGSRATGKFQAAVTASFDHLFNLNDLFYFSYNHDVGGGTESSRGSQGQALHYSVPYGYWQWSINASENSYRQAVAGINQTYLYSGTSDNADVRLSRLFYRDAIHKSSAYVKGWVRSSNNLIDDTEVEVQHRRMAGWELGLNHKATFSRTTLDASVALKRGTGAMGSLPAPEESFGEGSSRPRIITADLNIARPFKVGDAALRYTGQLRAQWNRTALVPQDRFAIGGRYTVRGFDGENSLSSDRGWLVRQDVSLAFGQGGPGTQEIYLAWDHGQVGGPSAKLLVGRTLDGMVVGWRGAIERLNYDLFWGVPVRRPEGFKTADSTGGFNLNLAY
jgi:hemolysin activation/secretion protein